MDSRPTKLSTSTMCIIDCGISTNETSRKKPPSYSLLYRSTIHTQPSKRSFGIQPFLPQTKSTVPYGTRRSKDDHPLSTVLPSRLCQDVGHRPCYTTTRLVSATQRYIRPKTSQRIRRWYRIGRAPPPSVCGVFPALSFFHTLVKYSPVRKRPDTP